MSFQVTSSSSAPSAPTPPQPRSQMQQIERGNNVDAAALFHRSTTSAREVDALMGGSATSNPGQGQGMGGSQNSYPLRASGTSPPMGPTTPIPAPYVSPSIHGSSSRMPPPFSLGPPISGAGGGAEDYMMPPSSAPPSSGSPMGGGQQGQPSGAGRGGTDPTKYKTTICRNWEQTGSCQFRGCTFAHGVDDLRPPARLGTSPLLSSVSASTMQTLLNASGSNPPPAGGSQGSGSAPPSAVGGSPLNATQSQGPAEANLNFPTESQAQTQLPAGTLRIEQIAELLVTEVHRQRDLVTVHVEANRTLENMLRREQQLKADTAARLAQLEEEIALMEAENKKKDQELAALATMAEQQSKKTMANFAASYGSQRGEPQPRAAVATNAAGDEASSGPGMTRTRTAPFEEDDLTSPGPTDTKSSGPSYSAISAGTPPSGGTPSGSPTASDDQLLAMLSTLNIGKQ